MTIIKEGSNSNLVLGNLTKLGIFKSIKVWLFNLVALYLNIAQNTIGKQTSGIYYTRTSPCYSHTHIHTAYSCHVCLYQIRIRYSHRVFSLIEIIFHIYVSGNPNVLNIHLIIKKSVKHLVSVGRLMRWRDENTFPAK